MSALAPSLQAWFTDRLANQLHASANTVAAYRDAWRLLLGYLQQRTGKQPSQLDLADLDATTISAFLDHLKVTATTASGPGTPATPRSDRSSSSHRYAIPSTPP